MTFDRQPEAALAQSRPTLMRGISLLACLCTVAALWAACAMPAAATTPEAGCSGVATIETAERTVTRGGQWVDTAIVTLPDRIPRAWRRPEFKLSYAVHVGACPASGGRRAIMFFRVGGPYEVLADGVALEPIRQNAHAAAPYNGRIGGLFSIDNATDTVAVNLLTLPNVAGGLIRVEVGPQAALLAGPALPHFRWQQFSLVTSALMGLAGLVGLCLWAARRQDRQTLWFSLACIVWGLRGQFLQLFSIPMPPFLYEQINPMAIMFSAMLVCASTLWSIRCMTRARALLLGWTSAASVAGFALSLAQPAAAPAYRMAAFVSAFLMLVWMVVLLASESRRLRPAHALWLGLGYGCVMVGAVHDFLMIVGIMQPGWWTLLTPGFTLLLLCHMVTVGMYILNNLKLAERSNEELEKHVAIKTQQLQQSYELLRGSESDAARAQERERLLRDMHDGLGAQLVTALRGLERGALAPQQVAQSLQDSLEELRLLMDSVDMSPYLPGALAAWRNRWDNRLAAAGIELVWRIDDSLDDLQLDNDVPLQLVRILQEAASNIVKHSQAKRMKLSAKVEAESGTRKLLMEISDDGNGPDLDTIRSGAWGLKNMHYRANQIGAQLAITSRPAPLTGCSVRVSLDVR